MSHVFKLKCVILERDDLQSVDRFGELILDQESNCGVPSNSSESDYDTVSLTELLRHT